MDGGRDRRVVEAGGTVYRPVRGVLWAAVVVVEGRVSRWECAKTMNSLAGPVTTYVLPLFG